MGSRVYDLCVYFMTGAPEGSTDFFYRESGRIIILLQIMESVSNYLNIYNINMT